MGTCYMLLCFVCGHGFSPMLEMKKDPGNLVSSLDLSSGCETLGKQLRENWSLRGNNKTGYIQARLFICVLVWVGNAAPKPQSIPTPSYDEKAGSVQK